MSQLSVGAEGWFETLRFGDDVTLIHEPWIKPFFRCNMWFVRGRDRNLLFDSGLGHFSLRAALPRLAEKGLICVASHTHFDHIGGHHEFPNRAVHRAEAAILAHPEPGPTLIERYATDDMFERKPEGWSAWAYRLLPAPASRLLDDDDVIDLGDRSFQVVHTPGHSPGGIGLFERRTGLFLSGDVIYDGPLVDDAYHSDRAAYVATMERLGTLPVELVHGGHFPSFGRTRFHQIIEEYVAGQRQAGCHLAAS